MAGLQAYRRAPAGGLLAGRTVLRVRNLLTIYRSPPGPTEAGCWRAGEHLRASLLACGCAADPHETLEAAVGPGHLHCVAGGWAPDARALLEGVGGQPAAPGVAGRA